MNYEEERNGTEEVYEAPDLLSIYLKELQDIPPLAAGEEPALVRRARSGDQRARDRLTEGYLMHALQVMRGHMGGPVGVNEMIGISNFAVVRAVREYLASENDEKNAAEAFQKPSLRDTITAAVEEELKEAEARERAASDADSLLAEQANRMTELSKELSAELGRAPTAEELSVRLGIPAEEVQSLIRMTMQALAD